MSEGFGCFVYWCETWFLLLREKHKYFRRRCIGQCLDLGDSAGRAAGPQDCLIYINFEKIKINIWKNIFNRSPIENVYAHIYFNFLRDSHPGKFDTVWTEDRQKMGGRTELHN
jgi:hypothetical protein